MQRWMITLAAWMSLTAALGQEPPTEADYYPMVAAPIPKSIAPEIGAIEQFPDGRLMVSTRRGDIYQVDGFMDDDASDTQWKRYAGGLHEVLGLAYRDGWLYATQRGEVTRLRDTDGDGKADTFQTVSDAWEINGDYHEYALGSKFDREGNIWVCLCLTGSFSSQNKFRGWCLKVNADGTTVPVCSGVRSPGGVGANLAGDMFYTDNQGPWNGTCGLKHLKPGTFQGHPGGNRWYETDEAKAAMGEQPVEPESGSRIAVQRERIPQLTPTAIFFPYKKMGQSASGVVVDHTDGKFGPFAGQMFVGDQTFSTVMRCDLEKVNGVYQGACFPFREGFGSGSLGVHLTDDGVMLVGGTNRGWGSRGNKPYALDRISWSGKTPFEIQTMRLEPDGFTLHFTQPVDATTASDLSSYTMETYTYIYQSQYGSPEVDRTEPKLVKAEPSEDGKSVRLRVDGLQKGHVHELKAAGVRNRAGLPLLHAQAYYTLNEFRE